MNEDQSVKDALNKAKKGTGKRTAYLIGGVAAVAIVIGAFFSSTRGTDVEESSAAMVESVPDPNQAATSLDARPPAVP